MRKLTKLQKKLLNCWLDEAEKNDLSTSDMKSLDVKLSALISSIEYEKPLLYFSRLIESTALA